MNLKSELTKLFEKFNRLGYNEDQVINALYDYFDKKEEVI